MRATTGFNNRLAFEVLGASKDQHPALFLSGENRNPGFQIATAMPVLRLKSRNQVRYQANGAELAVQKHD